jgi:hypothetical protein
MKIQIRSAGLLGQMTKHCQRRLRPYRAYLMIVTLWPHLS